MLTSAIANADWLLNIEDIATKQHSVWRTKIRFQYPALAIARAVSVQKQQMELVCPNCNQPISNDNINVATDLAQCGHCKSIHKASELASNTEETSLSKPPTGSKISMSKGTGSGIELTLPNGGLSFSHIPNLIFTLFWLGFVAFWTWGASKGSIFFALLSIPFWIIGFTMLIGLINSVGESQTLRITKNKLTIIKRKVINSKTINYSLDEIQSIKLMPLRPNSFSAFNDFKQLRKLQQSSVTSGGTPAIITGVKTEYFFEKANDAEQEWVTKFVNTVMKKVKK